MQSRKSIYNKSVPFKNEKKNWQKKKKIDKKKKKKKKKKKLVLLRHARNCLLSFCSFASLLAWCHLWSKLPNNLARKQEGKIRCVTRGPIKFYVTWVDKAKQMKANQIDAPHMRTDSQWRKPSTKKRWKKTHTTDLQNTITQTQKDTKTLRQNFRVNNWISITRPWKYFRKIDKG